MSATTSVLIFIISIGAILCGWYLVINWRNWRARLLAPVRVGVTNYSPSKYIEIDGFKVHYLQDGRGLDLLLVHGVGGSVISWAPVFNELKKSYRVTAVDLPGFGRSDKRLDREYSLDAQAERLEHFMKALKLEKPFAMAHSMGGAIVTWLAHIRPHLFRKLLLIAPALNNRIVAVHPSLLTWVMRSTRRFLVNKALIRWVYTKRTTHNLPANTEELIEEYYRPYANNRDAVEVFWRHTHLLRDKRLPASLGNFKTPTLILIGRFDRVVPARYLTRFQKLNPHVETQIVKDCGHQVMEENPKFLLECVHEFLV